MAKVFRPSTRESSILSKIESSKEFARRRAIQSVRDCIDVLANGIASKLVENELVETHNKNSLQERIHKCLETLTNADDFDIDYQIAPFRRLVTQPHVVSLYVTAFVIENLINEPRCFGLGAPPPANTNGPPGRPASAGRPASGPLDSLGGASINSRVVVWTFASSSIRRAMPRCVTRSRMAVKRFS